MDLQDSVQRSLQNPAEKILQICTDWQRSKTWVVPSAPPRPMFERMHTIIIAPHDTYRQVLAGTIFRIFSELSDQKIFSELWEFREKQE